MLKVKSIGIAIAIICSLFFVDVKKSDALEIITWSETSTAYDWGSGGWHSGRIEVDEGDCYAVFYVNNVFHSKTWISAPNTSADFTAYLQGDIMGTEHTLSAHLVNFPQFTPFEHYDVKVYKPDFEAVTKLNVSGAAYLYSLDYSHPYITPSGDVNGYYTGAKLRQVFHRFRHILKGPGINKDEQDVTPGGDPIQLPRSGYSASIPGTLSFSLIRGESDQEYTSQVYVRLEVSGQDDQGVERKVNWFAGANEGFTSE